MLHARLTLKANILPNSIGADWQIHRIHMSGPYREGWWTPPQMAHISQLNHQPAQPPPKGEQEFKADADLAILHSARQINHDSKPPEFTIRGAEVDVHRLDIQLIRNLQMIAAL